MFICWTFHVFYRFALYFLAHTRFCSASVRSTNSMWESTHLKRQRKCLLDIGWLTHFRIHNSLVAIAHSHFVARCLNTKWWFACISTIERARALFSRSIAAGCYCAYSLNYTIIRTALLPSTFDFSMYMTFLRITMLTMLLCLLMLFSVFNALFSWAFLYIYIIPAEHWKLLVLLCDSLFHFDAFILSS